MERGDVFGRWGEGERKRERVGILGYVWEGM